MKSTDWIATRTLKSENQNHASIEVKIGSPEQVSDQEWRCAYVVTAIDHEVRYAYGIDAFQSLMLALTAIRTYLDASRVSYTWAGGSLGDVGFPKSVPTFLGLAFSQRMETMLQTEMEKFASALQDKHGRV